MRAVQIISDAGPPQALALVDVPSLGEQSWLGGEPVVVEVEAAGVSFPELLQTRGLYQIKPPLPFVPGSEVAGRVRSAPAGSGLQPGQRVAAFCGLGGFAQEVVAPAHLTFPLPDALDFAQGAGLVLNYHTAYFALAQRGALAAGESVLVHGAAGGVGTAAIQVARALGARTIGLVSSQRKREIALEAGADEALVLDEGWRDAVKEASGGGVDVVLDPVGGDRFTDSLRCLRENGRLVVVGFTAGSIPEVKVNRLLLNNISVVGAGWGAAALAKPELCREIGQALDRMIGEGFVAPIVGARFPLERAADALQLLESRDAVGKVVLELPST
jgi:NADPH2:quinone reductase